MADSLALVKLFNMTGGNTHWVNKTNWLSNQPLSTWHGITVMNGRVTKIDLGGNNLIGEIPFDVNNITALKELKLDANFIEILPNLSPISLDNLELLEARQNKLTFEDWEHNIDLINDVSINVFFSPQDSVGMPMTHNRGVGHEDTLSVSVGGDNHTYQWFKDGTPITGATDSLLIFDDLEPDDAGWYFCEVSTDEPELSLLIIYSHQEQLIVEYCMDPLGGIFPCDEIIVRFVPGTSNSVKNAIRAEYGATVIESCRCDFLEIWDMPDSVSLEGSNKGETACVRMKAEVEDADVNYELFLPTLPNSITIPNDPPPGNTNSDPNKVTIAVIDSGIDYSHPSLANFIWRNTPEYPIANVGDNDGNCYQDDYMGWNFADDDEIPFDLNGHGTHIAGIITNGLTNAQVELMNLKFTNGEKGSIFDATCAVYYAIDKDADLINASWGFQGLPSTILEDAIEEAGTNCGILFTCSAGNGGSINNDNPSTPHHPSNAPFDNVLAVSSWDSGANMLAGDSRFGPTKVDLAANGVNIISTIPGGGTGSKSGTSQAAAMVSHAAVVLKNALSTSSFRGIKNCILNNTTMETNLAGLVLTEGTLNETNALNCISIDPFATQCGALIAPKIFLEGPFESTTGWMLDSLRTLGLIPLNQPFNTPPWNYPGSESITASDLMVTGGDAIVDWILVRYLDPSMPAFPNTVAALLQRDGDIVNTSGNPVNLGNVVEAGIIAITTRNHLGIKSTSTIDLNFQPTVIDFTAPAFPIEGGANSTTVIGGLKLIRGGDANHDGIIDIPNDMDLNFIPQNGTAPNYSNTADFDLNGHVNALDKIKIWYPNFSSGAAATCDECY